jgi:hypothetical protein
MQALPVVKTVEEYFTDSDVPERNVEGDMVRWHNKSDGAEERLKRYRDIPKSETRSRSLTLPGISIQTFQNTT